jgi:arylsulfatase A
MILHIPNQNRIPVKSPMGKSFLVLIHLVCWVTVFPLLSNAQQNPPRWNIVHILADDIGWDDISYQGENPIPTPNLDRLASQSVRLNQFYAPHSSCTPTRAALLTGRYAFRANGGKGIEILWPKSQDGLDPVQQKSLPTLLQTAGYSTALVGKWHLGNKPPFLPGNHGFQYFFGIRHPNDHGPERHGLTGSEGLDYILLWKNEKIIRPLSNADLAELPRQFVIDASRYIRQKAKEKQPFYLQYSNIETHTPWFVPVGYEGETGKGAYADALAFLDNSVGVLLQTLKDAGILDQTLVVFSSDNGPLVERYPELETCYGRYARVDTSRKRRLRGGKYHARYEGGCKVPCLIRLPATLNGMADGTDLFATMVNLAGAKLSPGYEIDGRDMMAWLTGAVPDTGMRSRFMEYNNGGRTAGSYRNGDWVLVFGKSKSEKPELYQISKDPGQKINLALREPDRLNELIKEAESRLARQK